MIEDASEFVLPAFEDDWSGGTRLLVAMIASEVFATATPAQAENFFTAVGRRIAAFVPVDDIADIAALEVRVNRLWQALHWGGARLDMGVDGIAIHHHGMPAGLENDLDGRWPAMAEAVLRGAYDSWFRTLGSGASLRTTVVCWSQDVMELRHGV